jgi:hypothetical protein
VTACLRKEVLCVEKGGIDLVSEVPNNRLLFSEVVFLVDEEVLRLSFPVEGVPYEISVCVKDDPNNPEQKVTWHTDEADVQHFVWSHMGSGKKLSTAYIRCADLPDGGIVAFKWIIERTPLATDEGKVMMSVLNLQFVKQWGSSGK